MPDADLPQALRGLLRDLLDGPNAFYSRRLKDAGLVDPEVLTLEDFRKRCPFTTKEELSDDQRANPPFGSNLGVPIAECPRLSRTSGTSGEPISWPDSERSWGAMLDAWEYIYRSAGLEPGKDRVFFAFSFGPFLGFWTAFEAASRMGCMTIPGGGMGSAARLSAIEELDATVLCCTPTYALRLGEEKRKPLGIRTIIVAGEPGGSLPAVRQQVSACWDGARVIDHHGMTEVGPVSFEVPGKPGNLCAIPGAHFVEILDRDSGVEVAEGGDGELVLTTLRRDDCPVLRYRTGDLVRKRLFEIDGQQLVGFEGGILGRIDDMVVVRGVNLYPSAIDAVLREFDQLLEYEVLQSSRREMAEISIRVELHPDAPDEVIDSMAAQLRESFSLRIPVERAKSGSLPRYEFKATRWKRA